MKALLKSIIFSVFTLCLPAARAADVSTGAALSPAVSTAAVAASTVAVSMQPAGFTLGPEVDAAWLAGIRHMYALEFDKAQTVFENLLADKPDEPAASLAMSGLLWWRYSQDYDIPLRQVRETADAFEKYANEAIDKSRSALKKNGKDANAWFVMGTAYGLLGRWYAVERRWWKAYTHGTKGRKYLKKALNLNPGITDAYAGLGIFDYYADTVPGALKIAALLFIHGDKKRGLEELDRAIAGGKFFVTEAKLFKIAILVQFEQDYKTAAALAVELRKSEPDNVFFRLSELLTRFNSNDWDGTLDEGMKFIVDFAGTANPGIARQLALVYVAVGDAYVMKKNYYAALDMFTRGIGTAYPEKGWVTYCYLRRAQVYDILGQRGKAGPDYKTAGEREDFWSTADDSARGLKKPYTLEEVEKQLQSH